MGLFLPDSRIVGHVWMPLLSEGIDAAVVASADEFHGIQIEHSFKKGIHVLTEKPLTPHLPEALRIQRLKKKHEELVGMVGLIMRYDPCVQAIEQAIELIGPNITGMEFIGESGSVRKNSTPIQDWSVHPSSIETGLRKKMPVSVAATSPARNVVDLEYIYDDGAVDKAHIDLENPIKRRALIVRGQRGSFEYEGVPTKSLRLLLTAAKEI